MTDTVAGAPPEGHLRTSIVVNHHERAARQGRISMGYRVALVLACLFAWILILQWLGSGYSSEFDGYPDEAAHYVTGLMVRDYLWSSQLLSPLKFAQGFYDYYPQVAIGHWPPAFYLGQAVWMLVFSPARWSLMLLLATTTGLTALLLMRWFHRELGLAAAAVAALLLVSLPLVQQYSRMVMAELPVTLFMLLAALTFARYLRTGRWQAILLFAIAASIAIMIKQNGLTLALLPPLTLLLTRRFDVLRRPSLWLSAVVVALLCGPWYVVTYEMANEGWVRTTDVSALATRLSIRNGGFIVDLVGWPLFILCFLGLYAQVARRWMSAQVAPEWAAMAALLASIWLFHSFVAPVGESRHMVSAAPPLVAFAVAGAQAIAGFAPERASRPALVTVLALMMAVFAVDKFEISPKPSLGSTALAEFILSRPELAHQNVLVSSEGDGEGAMIAEIAMLESRPGHRVIRATKALVETDWNAVSYRPKVTRPLEVLSLLEQLKVKAVVIEDRNSRSRYDFFHNKLLLQALTGTSRWINATAQVPAPPGRKINYSLFLLQP